MSERLLPHYLEAGAPTDVGSEAVKSVQDILHGVRATTALGLLLEKRQATMELMRRAEDNRSSSFNFLLEVQLEGEPAPAIAGLLGVPEVSQVERVLGDLVAADLTVAFEHNGLQKYSAWYPDLEVALARIPAGETPTGLLYPDQLTEFQAQTLS